MDYIQLEFSGSCLSAFNPLSVHKGEQSWSTSDSDWGNALRARIGQVVQNACCNDVELTIEFADGSEFKLSLRDEDYKGPEAFEFTSPNRPTVIE